MGQEERRSSESSAGVRSLGRYRIVAELARGGMGVVYLALVRGPGSFNKLLVLKELKPELLEQASIDRHERAFNVGAAGLMASA